MILDGFRAGRGIPLAWGRRPTGHPLRTARDSPRRFRDGPPLTSSAISDWVGVPCCQRPGTSVTPASPDPSRRDSRPAADRNAVPAQPDPGYGPPENGFSMIVVDSCRIRPSINHDHGPDGSQVRSGRLSGQISILAQPVSGGRWPIHPKPWQRRIRRKAYNGRSSARRRRSAARLSLGRRSLGRRSLGCGSLGRRWLGARLAFGMLIGWGLVGADCVGRGLIGGGRVRR
jgi:hypothetical protein